jgi:hypothetical protein
VNSCPSHTCLRLRLHRQPTAADFALAPLPNGGPVLEPFSGVHSVRFSHALLGSAVRAALCLLNFIYSDGSINRDAWRGRYNAVTSSYAAAEFLITCNHVITSRYRTPHSQASLAAVSLSDRSL